MQYPIKLAWAVTIHKSQGLTFEKAMIDISQAFAAGQTYVALSRLTSLKGLVLASPVRWSGPETDKALSFFAQSKTSVDDANIKYKTQSKQYVNNRISEAFNFNGLTTALREHIGTYNKDTKKSAKQKYLGWAQNQLKNTQAIVEISDKFQNQIKSIIKSDKEDYLMRLKERLIAAKDYFLPLLKEKQDEIEKQINVARKEKGIKTYLKELKELQGIFYGQILVIHKAEALCRAILNNEELNNETLRSITGMIKKPDEENKNKSKPARLSADLSAEQAGKAGPAGGKKKKEKAKPKIKTAQITYELYKQGKTIEEIVEERSLNIRTIEGHISDCITQGKIKVSELIVQERIDEITNAATELDTMFLKPIKEHLGDDFSCPEIKFVMSWMKYKNTIEK